jgi:hypothetical protein
MEHEVVYMNERDFFRLREILAERGREFTPVEIWELLNSGDKIVVIVENSDETEKLGGHNEII